MYYVYKDCVYSSKTSYEPDKLTTKKFPGSLESTLLLSYISGTHKRWT